jgi:hypothetical protein
MKRIIYEPAVDEEIPNGNATVTYILPVAGVSVMDVIVEDSFTTAGTIYYDSTVAASAVFDDEGNEISPEVIAQELAEPFIHHFAGWER